MLTHFLFGAFLLGMALLFFGQFVFTSPQDNGLRTTLRRVLGVRGFNALTALYPSSLMPLTRFISLVLGSVMTALLVYYILSLLAVYAAFNPFGITPGIGGGRVPN